MGTVAFSPPLSFSALVREQPVQSNDRGSRSGVGAQAVSKYVNWVIVLSYINVVEKYANNQDQQVDGKCYKIIITFKYEEIIYT